jgi:hypothetical protein
MLKSSVIYTVYLPLKHHNLTFYNMYVHVHTPSPHVQAHTYSFILHGRFVFKFQIRIILAINHLKTSN